MPAPPLLELTALQALAGGAVPANTVAPAATGTTAVGKVLTSTQGTFSNSPTSYVNQWQDSIDGTTGWTDVSAANALAYLIGAGERTKFLRCRVVAANASGNSAAAYSNVVGPVGTAVGPFAGRWVYQEDFVTEWSDVPVVAVAVVSGRWRFVITDLDGAPLGEPHAFDRQIDLAISSPSTASFRIRTDDPMWAAIADSEAMLKVYDATTKLRHYGPIVSDEETGSGQGGSVKVNSADLMWRLGYRYVGKDPAGVGMVETATDSGAIANAVLAAVNADMPTGITPGTTGTFVGQDVTYLWKKALDAIAELGSIDGSYEWALRYTDGQPPAVQLDLAATTGTDKSATVFFEYGTGKRNCSGYSRIRDRSQLATHVWALSGGSTIVAAASDEVAAAGLRSRYEDVLTFSDITVDTLLDSLAIAHVRIRSAAKRVYALTPFPSLAPVYGRDYVVGDRVTCRIVGETGLVRLNGSVRVWGVTVSINDAGEAVESPRLVP